VNGRGRSDRNWHDGRADFGTAIEASAFLERNGSGSLDVLIRNVRGDSGEGVFVSWPGIIDPQTEVAKDRGPPD
jgi:hypothetical protein